MDEITLNFFLKIVTIYIDPSLIRQHEKLVVEMSQKSLRKHDNMHRIDNLKNIGRWRFGNTQTIISDFERLLWPKGYFDSDFFESADC